MRPSTKCVNFYYFFFCIFFWRKPGPSLNAPSAYTSLCRDSVKFHTSISCFSVWLLPVRRRQWKGSGDGGSHCQTPPGEENGLLTLAQQQRSSPSRRSQKYGPIFCYTDRTLTNQKFLKKFGSYPYFSPPRMCCSSDQEKKKRNSAQYYPRYWKKSAFFLNKNFRVLYYLLVAKNVCTWGCNKRWIK